MSEYVAWCMLACAVVHASYVACCVFLTASSCVRACVLHECIGGPSAWDGAGSPQPCRCCAGRRMYLRRRNARVVNRHDHLQHALPRTGNGVRATAAHVRCCCRSDRPCGSAACRSGAAAHPIANIVVSLCSTVYRRPDIAAPRAASHAVTAERSVCVCWCVCVCV
jgi:hypothetical protein